MAAPLLTAEGHNLPAALTRFVGREDEVAGVAALLQRGRLVTLTGPGGIGKTRLAVEAAGWMVERFPDGVWLVELASLREPDLLCQDVLHQLSLVETSGERPEQTLGRHLASRRALLVLDNCEHLAAAVAALVARLLSACPRLAVLATSRQDLGVPGEVTWPVRPLTVPDPARLPEPEELPAYESVRLFLDRAAAARRGFVLRDVDARPVATICARLDGVPLAIELAAARVAALAPEEIARRLDDRFALLSAGPLGGPERHRTLRALVEWSHDLLDVQERRLLRRLSVFRGGFDLDAVEAVAGGTLSVLAQLVAKSMVAVDHGARTRDRLLETAQAFAAGQLEAAGESQDAAAAHLGWVRSLAGSPDALGRELENLRQALAWSVSSSAVETGLALAVAVTPFWLLRGHPTEGRHWLALLLDGAGDAVPRGPALAAADRLALAQGDLEAAEELLGQARADVQSEDEVADLLLHIGAVASLRGDEPAALAAYEEAMAAARALGLPTVEAVALRGLGNVARHRGDLERAATLYGEGLAVARSAGATRDIAALLNNLGSVAKQQGRYEEAQALLEESVEHKEALGDRRGLAVSHINLGAVATVQLDGTAAAWHYDRAIELLREVGATDGLIVCVHGMAEVAALHDERPLALTLMAAHDALRERLGYPLPPADAADRAWVLDRASTGLPADTIAEAQARGAALTLDEALALRGASW